MFYHDTAPRMQGMQGSQGLPPQGLTHQGMVSQPNIPQPDHMSLVPQNMPGPQISTNMSGQLTQMNMSTVGMSTQNNQGLGLHDGAMTMAGMPSVVQSTSQQPNQSVMSPVSGPGQSQQAGGGAMRDRKIIWTGTS